MKLYKYFVLIFLISTMKSYCQTAIKENISIEKNIESKRKEAEKLWRTFKYKKALAITKQCIKEADSIKNDSLLGKSYNTFGIINDHLGKMPTALESYKKAVDIFTRMKNYKRIGLAYNNIAVAYSKANIHLDSSIVYYKKALTIFEQIKVSSEILLVASNLGEIYRMNNELKKAKISLEKAVYHAKRIPIKTKEDKISLCYAYETYAEMYFKKNNLKKTLKYLNLAQEIAEKENLEHDLVFIYKLKSTILEKLGDTKNAYAFLKKHDTHIAITNEIESSRLAQETAIKFEIKENNALLEKTALENTVKINKLKKSRQVIFFMSILFLIAVITSLLLYKNNALKIKNSELLVLKNEELKKLKYQTELKFLKTKIQPHFFFKTLNILDALVLEKSENAKDVVLKLSDLMQYSIYKAKKENVSIWDEINNIQNYLEIESLYKKEKIPSIQIDGKIEHIKVPPLLYFSFIENCFDINNAKHHNNELFIFFTNVDDKYLLFSLNCGDTPFEVKKENSNEIVVKNIERRLKLIYKNNFSLSIQSTKDTFSASLKIPITKLN